MFHNNESKQLSGWKRCISNIEILWWSNEILVLANIICFLNVIHKLEPTNKYINQFRTSVNQFHHSQVLWRPDHEIINFLEKSNANKFMITHIYIRISTNRTTQEISINSKQHFLIYLTLGELRCEKEEDALIIFFIANAS